MNVKLSYLLVGALAVAGAMSSAHADVVEVEGVHVKFLYDTDFWGLNSAVVKGDTITFAIDPAFSLTRTVAQNGVPVTASHVESNAQALTVVAKAGYQVGFGVSTIYSGTFALGSGDNSMAIGGSGLLAGGNYSNGVFSRESASASYGGAISFFNGTSGTIDQTDKLAVKGGFGALQASVGLSSALSQSGPGTSSAALTSFEYGFTATPQAAPVPEPATYGLMLGGIGLLGMVARRRKNAPK